MKVSPALGVISDDSIHRVCSTCFLERPSRRGGGWDSCPSCRMVSFCSSECRHLAPLGLQHHELECVALRRLRQLLQRQRRDEPDGDTSGFDTDMVRMGLRLMARRDVEGPGGGWAAVLGLGGGKYRTGEMRAETRGSATLVVDVLGDGILGVHGEAAREDKVLAMARVLDDLESNVFGVFCRDGFQAGMAAYVEASLFNHSCVPNAARLQCGKDVLVVALGARDLVPEGAELTLSYIDNCLPHARRRKELLENWHFACDCPRCCRVPPEEYFAEIEARKDLAYEDLMALLEAEPESRAPADAAGMVGALELDDKDDDGIDEDVDHDDVGEEAKTEENSFEDCSLSGSESSSESEGEEEDAWKPWLRERRCFRYRQRGVRCHGFTAMIGNLDYCISCDAGLLMSTMCVALLSDADPEPDPGWSVFPVKVREAMSHRKVPAAVIMLPEYFGVEPGRWLNEMMATLDTLSMRLEEEKQELWVYDEELRVDVISVVLRATRIAWIKRPSVQPIAIFYGSCFIEK